MCVCLGCHCLQCVCVVYMCSLCMCATGNMCSASLLIVSGGLELLQHRFFVAARCSLVLAFCLSPPQCSTVEKLIMTLESVQRKRTNTLNRLEGFPCKSLALISESNIR